MFNNQVFQGRYGKEGGNFITILSHLQRGQFKPSSLNKVAEDVLMRNLKCFQVSKRVSITDRKVSAIAWHPINPLLFVCGGTAGTLRLYNGKYFHYHHVSGTRHAVESIRFFINHSSAVVCSASQNSHVIYFNFEDLHKTSLIDSGDQSLWFCAVDIHQDGKSVYGGDCQGNLAIHHLDSGKTEIGHKHLKLHGAKIRHLELSPRDPNLMVTSSLDKTVKLWDMRKLNGSKSYIASLKHDYGVAAAKFSRTDGCRLLTTDSYSQLRVYRAPFWNQEHKITHPHRHHHITIIRASWHPQADLFLVGRYPDPKLMEGDATPAGLDDLRSIDVYSASSAKLCHEFLDTSNLITSLTEFNTSGTILASTAGRHISFWKSDKNNGR